MGNSGGERWIFVDGGGVRGSGREKNRQEGEVRDGATGRDWRNSGRRKMAGEVAR